MSYYNGTDPMAELSRFGNDAEAAELDKIGRKIGYGRSQQILQLLWAQNLKEQDLPMMAALGPGL